MLFSIFDVKAINLVESVRKGKYNLIQSDIQQISKIKKRYEHNKRKHNQDQGQQRGE